MAEFGLRGLISRKVPDISIHARIYENAGIIIVIIIVARPPTFLIIRSPTFRFHVRPHEQSSIQRLSDRQLNSQNAANDRQFPVMQLLLTEHFKKARLASFLAVRSPIFRFHVLPHEQSSIQRLSDRQLNSQKAANDRQFPVMQLLLPEHFKKCPFSELFGRTIADISVPCSAPRTVLHPTIIRSPVEQSKGRQRPTIPRDATSSTRTFYKMPV